MFKKPAMIVTLAMLLVAASSALAFENGDFIRDLLGWYQIQCSASYGPCEVVAIAEPDCNLVPTGESWGTVIDFDGKEFETLLYRCGDAEEAGIQWHPFTLVKENEGWAIWDFDGNKVGSFVEGEIPEHNELIVGNNSVSLYRLATGEWQINWNHDGKTDVVISNSVEGLATEPLH